MMQGMTLTFCGESKPRTNLAEIEFLESEF